MITRSENKVTCVRLQVDQPAYKTASWSWQGCCERAIATYNNRPDDDNGDDVGDDDDDDTMDAVASTIDRLHRNLRPLVPLARPGPLLPRPRDLLFSRKTIIIIGHECAKTFYHRP